MCLHIINKYLNSKANEQTKDVYELAYEQKTKTPSTFTLNRSKLLQSTLPSVEINDVERTRALFVSKKKEFGEDLNGK
jgi:hypothetical protein